MELGLKLYGFPIWQKPQPHSKGDIITSLLTTDVGTIGGAIAGETSEIVEALARPSYSRTTVTQVSKKQTVTEHWSISKLDILMAVGTALTIYFIYIGFNWDDLMAALFGEDEDGNRKWPKLNVGGLDYHVGTGFLPPEWVSPLAGLLEWGTEHKRRREKEGRPWWHFRP